MQSRRLVSSLKRPITRPIPTLNVEDERERERHRPRPSLLHYLQPLSLVFVAGRDPGHPVPARPLQPNLERAVAAPGAGPQPDGARLRLRRHRGRHHQDGVPPGHRIRRGESGVHTMRRKIMRSDERKMGEKRDSEAENCRKRREE